MKRNFFIFQFCVLACLFSESAFAQHPYSWQLTEENGLPSNVVYDLLQDARGYVWIGTNKGLVRYNGTHFQNYNSNKQKRLSLTHLQEDEQGRVWCVNFSRQVFYAEGDSLFEFEIGPKNTEETEGHVKIKLIDSLLYVYSYQHADRFNTLTKVWERDFYKDHWPRNEESGNRNSLFSISGKDQTTNLAFGHEIHLWQDESNPKVVSISHENTHHRGWVDNSLILLSEGSVSVLPYGSNTNSATVLDKVFPDHDTRLLHAIKDREEALWVCTPGGAVRVNKQLSEATKTPIFFPEQQVSDVLLDKESNRWFSTLQNGVFIVPDESISVYNTQNSNIASDHIHSLGSDENGNILLGTSDGLVQQHTVLGQFSSPICLVAPRYWAILSLFSRSGA